jgi:hypothetical protein
LICSPMPEQGPDNTSGLIGQRHGGDLGWLAGDDVGKPRLLFPCGS